jgi:hypothetical protein
MYKLNSIVRISPSPLETTISRVPVRLNPNPRYLFRFRDTEIGIPNS